MSRREQIQTPIEPDVEASQAELARLKGEQESVQTATLAVAENKKKLESDYEAAKKRLDDELEQKRADTDREIKALDAATVRAKGAREKAEQDLASAKDALKHAERELDETRTEAQKATATLNTAKADAKRLSAQCVALETKMEDCKASLPGLESKKKVLESEISLLGQMIEKAKSDREADTAAMAARQAEHELLGTTKVAREAELKAISEQTNEAKTELARAKESLIEIQKQANAQTTAMQTEKEARDVAVGNASRLEKRVDQKLSTLRELEKEFNTEHLARVGYKKFTE